MRQAVILAGGKGTRLRERLGDLPKPLIPIGDRPLLGHQLALCKQHGFLDIVLLLGHGAEQITTYVRDGNQWGLRVQSVVERGQLGTGGAVLAALPSLDNDFLVLYGDLMVNIDLERLWRAHELHQAGATLVLHPNDHPFDSDLVEADNDGWIRTFHPRPHPPDMFFQNLVNAAVYVINRRSLESWADSGSTRTRFGAANRHLMAPDVRRGRNDCATTPAAPLPLRLQEQGSSEDTPTPLDFGKDVFPAMLTDGCRLFGYRSPEYVKDIGTPERYDRVCAEYECGVVERGSLKHTQPAVFMDRDGTLNEEVGGVTSPDQLRLLPGVGEAVRLLNHHGIRVVVVTNQPVVAKGFCTESDVENVHRKLEWLLGREHAFLDRIYYCPHHPERGFPGERPELKIVCECRKPKPGLVHRAMRDLNIDPARSWFVGDSTIDVATARNSGLRSILVRTGHKGLDGRAAVEPDFTFDDLLESARYIVESAEELP